MTLNTFSGGVNTSFSSQLNANFKGLGTVAVLYTSTGFDANVTGANTATAALELSDISAATLGGADYLSIEIFGRSYVKSDENSLSQVTLTIQTKDLSGTSSYADSMTEKDVLINGSTGSTRPDSYSYASYPLRWLHTLTAAEKVHGVKVNIKSKALSQNAGGAAQFNNYQTVVRTGI